MKTFLLFAISFLALFAGVVGLVCLIAKPWTFHDPMTLHEKYLMQMTVHCVSVGIITLSLGGTLVAVTFFRRK